MNDHDKEFENQWFTIFYEENKINHKVSSHRTLKQNGIIEKKRSLEKMTSYMICKIIYQNTFRQKWLALLIM